jgi:hypothetical protein
MPESPAGLLCDVGAGDSALAAWLLRHGTDLAGICLFDTSSEMLAHSARWVARGATADVACAEALPIADGGADLVVASLADPYDTASSHPSSNDSASKLSELRAAVNYAAGDPRFRRSGRVKLTTALATSSGRVRGARAALVAVEPASWGGLRVLAQRFSAIVSRADRAAEPRPR